MSLSRAFAAQSRTEVGTPIEVLATVFAYSGCLKWSAIKGARESLPVCEGKLLHFPRFFLLVHSEEFESPTF